MPNLSSSHLGRIFYYIDPSILIHLYRNDMFELSHRLIGIYKTSNQTRSMCCLTNVVALIRYSRHFHRQSFFAINDSCSSKYNEDHDSLIYCVPYLLYVYFKRRMDNGTMNTVAKIQRLHMVNWKIRIKIYWWRYSARCAVTQGSCCSLCLSRQFFSHRFAGQLS